MAWEARKRESVVPAERLAPVGALSLPPAALFLFGFASFVYQIVRVRRFSVVLGTTNTAITPILAMFLGGPGLGALLAGSAGARLGVARLARRSSSWSRGQRGLRRGLRST